MNDQILLNFQYQKEVARLVFGERKDNLGHKMLTFAKKWMKFVMTKCERGRGTRPRYRIVFRTFTTVAFFVAWFILVLS